MLGNSAKIRFLLLPPMSTLPSTPVAAPAGTGAVASPCISVCQMNPANSLCEGCLRTIDEIAHWGLFDDDEKRAVWSQLEARRATQR